MPQEKAERIERFLELVEDRQPGLLDDTQRLRQMTLQALLDLLTPPSNLVPDRPEAARRQDEGETLKQSFQANDLLAQPAAHFIHGIRLILARQKSLATRLQEPPDEENT